MCIQFFLEYQHCNHHHYLGEQHCSDSPLCVRNAPLTYRLTDNHTVPRPPVGHSSDTSTNSQHSTCESCLSISSEQLDPDQVPVQYYPPNNNFNVKLRRNAGFGEFVRVEEYQSDAKSLSDVDSDEDDERADDGGAVQECHDPAAALNHRILLDKQLQNLPTWLAYQQSHQVYEAEVYAPAQYWYTPWGTVTLEGMEGHSGEEGLLADCVSPAPLYSLPSFYDMQTPLSQEGGAKANSRLCNQPQDSSYSYMTSSSGAFTYKPFTPRSSRSRESMSRTSTAVTSAIPSRAETPDGLPLTAFLLSESTLPRMRRDSILSKAPKNPRAVRRRSGSQLLDQLPVRKFSLEHYVVKGRGRRKKVEEQMLDETDDGTDAEKENVDGEAYDGGEAKTTFIDEGFEAETEEKKTDVEQSGQNVDVEM